MKVPYKKLSLPVSAPAVALFAVLAFSLLTGTGSLTSTEAFLIGLVFHAGFSSVPAMIDIRRGKFPDFEFPERRKRRKYYFFAALGDGIGLLAYYWSGAPALSALALTYVLSASLVGLINEKWKISAHAAGLTGPLVLALALFGLNASPLLVLVPLTFWLRIKTGAHNFLQLAGGGLLAAGCALASLAALRLL
ncbi:hypothetical protein HYS54_02530 [Candidatus Micrarchaeota archaeon]|nr:hypothetical protein [Candidatus Micrarchaeota archaeon]